MRNAATQEALRSAMRYRHGAIITKGGKILGQGHNHVRTGFSGPLSAHEAIVLPMRRGLDDCTHIHTHEGASHAGARGQSYFSMHAEMHAVTSALRGARPHNIPRSSVLLDPMESTCAQFHDMTLEMQDGSRCSDVPTAATKRVAAGIKAKCDRALVEGAKREQQRIAFAPDSEWCLKPRYKKRIEEKPTPRTLYHLGQCAPRAWTVGWQSGGASIAY